MRIRILVVLAMSALVVSACSNAAEELTEQIVESSGDGDVEVDVNDGTVSISVEGEDGSGAFTIGGGELPEDFPVPIPDGGDVASVFEGEGDAAVSVLYDDGNYDEVAAFYEDWVAGADMPEMQTASAEFDGMKSTQWFSPPAGIFISVGEGLDEVIVTINITG
jgi:hypothetical protein